MWRKATGSTGCAAWSWGCEVVDELTVSARSPPPPEPPRRGRSGGTRRVLAGRGVLGAAVRLVQAAVLGVVRVARRQHRLSSQKDTS